MSGIDDLTARLTVLETVVQQLVTHMAVRDDDPSAWVRTRKALAMSAFGDDPPDRFGPPVDYADLRDAVSGFFENLEHVARDYEFAGGGAFGRTQRHARR